MNRLRKVGTVLAVVLIGGQLYAQPAPSESTTTEIADARGQVEAARAQVKADTRQVQRLQALARREKDVLKLSCVNDHMVRIKAETNIFDDKVAAFEATVDGDWTSSFGEVRNAANAVRKAREDAERCVGDTELTGESDASYRAPEIIDDPTQASPYDVVLEPPAYASPYR